MSTRHQYKSTGTVKSTWRVVSLLLLLAACGNAIGPSNDKVRLDVEDLIKAQTKGLLKVARLDIDRRKVLSEDRVQLQMTVFYKADQEELRKANKAVGILRANPFGAMGAFELSGAIDKTITMDGKSEQFTWIYRAAGNGLWRIAESYDGHVGQ